MGELAFVSNYKEFNWKDKVCYKFSDDAEGKSVASALSEIHKIVTERSFNLLKNKEIDEYVDSLVNGNGLNAAADAIEKISMKEIEKAVGKDKKLLYAVYVLRSILEKTGCPLFLEKKKLETGKPEELDGEGILFYSSCKEWVVIKRMAKYDDTKKEEFMGILASINEAVVEKMFQFSNINQEEMTNEVNKLTNGVRKGYPKLAEVIRKIPNKSSEEQAFFLYLVLTNLKYDSFIRVPLVVKVYPEMKKLFKKRKKKKKS